MKIKAPLGAFMLGQTTHPRRDARRIQPRGGDVTTGRNR